MVTYYVVQSFEISPKGRFKVGNPVELRSREQAIRQAERIAKEQGGAIAFSRTGDAECGEFEDAVILGKFGELPDDLNAA